MTVRHWSDRNGLFVYFRRPIIGLLPAATKKFKIQQRLTVSTLIAMTDFWIQGHGNEMKMERVRQASLIRSFSHEVS